MYYTVLFESLKEWSARHTAVAQFFNLPRRDFAHITLTDEAFQQLLEGAKHPNPKVRFTCAHLADHPDDERCFEILYSLCKDEIPKVRAEALHGIACEQCKSCPLPINGVALLVEAALYDPSVKVRLKVVNTFANHSPDERITQALVQVAQQDAHETIQQRAAEVLQQLNHFADSSPSPL